MGSSKGARLVLAGAVSAVCAIGGQTLAASLDKGTTARHSATAVSPGQPVPNLCYDYCGGGQDFGGFIGMGDFGQALMDFSYGVGVYDVGEDETPPAPIELEKVWVTGNSGRFASLCDLYNCRLLPVVNNVPFGDSIGGGNISNLTASQIQKYLQDHVPVPVNPVQNNCGLSPQSRQVTSQSSGEAIENMVNEYYAIQGMTLYTATWNIPLADGGIVQVTSNQGFAAFATWELVKPGDGVARPGMCQNMG